MLIHRICSVIAALILLSPAAAQWFTREATDPLDDLPTVFSSLESIEGTGGFDSKPIELTIVCKPDDSQSFRFGKTPMITMVMVNWHQYLGYFDTWHTVTYRFSSAPTISSFWTRQDDTTFLLERAARSFLRKLVLSDRLVIRTEGMDTAIFDLAGVKAAVEPIAEKCKWRLYKKQKKRNR